ncbi:SulP family inorganic anion transporter [Thermocrinis sp.]|uniref:SulP family inorganic anion transporter n=1 Tax=Thermocrinis sp. TaxID=2024383 RepID=UPI002FDD0C71
MSPKSIVQSFSLNLGYLNGYNKEKFIKDLVAGLTVAAVLVPQAKAYALLAGMPPINGLYASLLAPLVAVIFGSSRFLGTGPVAMVAILVTSTLLPFAKPGTSEWVGLAGLLALMVGITILLIGIFRLAFILDLISHSVIVGFISAGALVISANQLGGVLGFSTTKSTQIFSLLADIAQKLHQTNPYTVMVSILAFVIIYLSRKIHPLMPGALIAVVITTLISYLLDLKGRYGVSIVEDVPAGLPPISLPPIDLQVLSALWGGAIVVAAIGLLEALAIAKKFAVEKGDKWDPNKELVGQGLSNIVAGFMQGFPISGSFSRSALYYRLETASPIAHAVVSLVILITLLFFAPLFYYLPKATLSVIILTAVIPLVKPQEIRHLYHINPIDGVVAGLTFISVFIMELWQAILMGAILAFGSFVYKTMYPRIVVITRNPKTQTFENAEAEGLVECPQILYVRPQMSIYFGNAEYVSNYIVEKVQERKDRGLKFVFIDLEASNYMDAVGAENFIRMLQRIKSMGLSPALGNINRIVMPVLERAGLKKVVPEDMIFGSKGQSLKILLEEIDHQFCAKVCPHVVFKECVEFKSGEKKLSSWED